MEILKNEELELLEELKNDITCTVEKLEKEIAELKREEKYDFILKEIIDTLREGNKDFKYEMNNISRKEEIEKKMSMLQDYELINNEIQKKIQINNS